MSETGGVGGGRAVIDLETLPVIGYDLVHNGRPFITHLSVRSSGHSPKIDVVVRVQLLDGENLIAGPWEREYPMVPPTGVEIEPDLSLDPGFMRQVEEQRPVSLTVTVTSGDVTLTSTTRTLTLFARNQWMLVDGPYGRITMGLLAAHVQPNDPVIAGVLDQAREILRRRTGSASTQGYQSGAERAGQIAQAVYEAIVERGFNYSNPPGSWADPRQKIRSHAQVFSERAATCLDSAVLYAAALEAAGLNSTIWLPPGHALVGVWLVDAALRDPTVMGDAATSLALNTADTGRMVLVETTRMADQANFGQAVEAGRSAVNSTADPILAVVDVRAARLRGITPLPAVRTAADGSVEVHAYQAGSISVEKAPRAARTVERTSQVPLKVRIWKNALLDLSLRNQLINFRETATSLSLLVPQSSDQLHPLDFIEDQLHEDASFVISPIDIPELEGIRGAGAGADAASRQTRANLLVSERRLLANVDRERYPARMRKLRYASRSSVQESGTNNLYLTLGSLIWEHDGIPLKSPLILVPITLEGGARGAPFRLLRDESGASTPNFCLLEKLKVEHGLKLPELEIPLEDASGVAVAEIFTRVGRALADAELPFRIDETAHLAILQFAKFRLWKDLEDHWERFAQNRLVQHLTTSRTEHFQDHPDLAPADGSLDDLAAVCPVPADATQLRAIRAAVGGQTFVLEGPPGTGKSQTITNLLARAIAEGRRVLFVAEKRAALDVVQSRMQSVGLGPFCLDLHDKGSKPTLVRQQLLASLTHEPLRDPAGVEAAQGQLRSAVTILSRYRDRLHEPNRMGVSLYSAHERLLALRADDPDLEAIEVDPDEVATLTEDQWATLRLRLLDIGQAVDGADAELDGPWTLAGPLGFDTLDRAQLSRAIGHLVKAIDAALEHPAGVEALSLTLAGTTLERFRAFVSANPPPLAAIDAAAAPGWSARAHHLLNELARNAAAPALAITTPTLWQLPLDDILAQSVTADASSVFGRKKRRLAVLDQLRPGLRADSQPPEPKELTAVISSLVAARGDLVRGLMALDELPGIEGARGVNPLDGHGLAALRNRVATHEWLVAAVTQESPERSLLRAYAHYGGQAKPAVEAAEASAVAWADVCRMLRVDAASLARWSQSTPVLGRLTSVRVDWLADAEGDRFRRLSVWLEAAAAVGDLSDNGLHSVAAALLDRRVDPLQFESAVTIGVLEATLVERSREGRLDAFLPQAHERSVERFSRASGTLRTRMAEEIPADLIRSRPFNANALAGEVGALTRELNKERRGLSIRALLARYGSIITELTPCFLVSPDSAARFLEPGSIEFDLVVFDEASQIRVAEAIGAMGRGRAVIVVGDSRQMPPSTFGGGSVDDEGEFDDEADLAADEESILSECVQARVPREWLSWHYRSRDESLIAFSNSKYYEGKLSSFPAPRRSHASTSVRHVLVADGHFHRSGDRRVLRTNPREAQAVVAEVVRRFSADPAASVGVVTFNIQQRDLIINLLSACQSAAVVKSVEADGEDSLFVKNLESVQGDERDTIIFSLAFAKNDKGTLPLNFGPLNRQGGERRLNVAITRARSEVIVFSSFLPQDMRVESTESRGIKHVHDYLALAVRGADGLAQELGRMPTPEDRHRESVAGGLRARGWPVRTDVGLSGFRVDIVVGRRDGGDGDLAAILLDGPSWAGRPTVGDRDGLPVDVLTGMMRWPLVSRVWLPTWLQDHDGVLDRLEAELSEVSAQKPPERESSGTPERASAPAPTIDPPVASVDLSAFEREILADHPIEVPRVPPTLERLPSSAAQSEVEFATWDVPYLGSVDPATPTGMTQITDALRQGIDAEGPIHADRLVKLVANSLGIRRVSSERSAELRRLLPMDRVRTQGGAVLWPTGSDPSTFVEYRPSRPVERELKHVPAIEIGNAMVLPVEHSMGVEREELLRLAMRIYHGERFTAAIRAVMQAGLEDAISRDRLKVRDGLIVRGSRP